MARPRYHFCPMGGWMNDPNGGIYADGEYHFFYLQDPFDGKGFSGAVMPDGTVVDCREKPNRFWGHAKTADFIHWDYLPEALVPDRGNGERKPISGSVVRREDGSFFMAFTSVREDGTNCQWGAAACEGLNRWERLEKPLVEIPEEMEIAGDWRDPYLFFYEEKAYMVVGAATEDEALLLLYEAEDGMLERWRYQGIFLSKPVNEVAFFECPRVLVLGGNMVLLFSPYQQVEYYTGEFLPEDGRFLVRQTGKVDYGLTAYAPVDVRDDSGDVYLLSWAPGWFDRKGISFDGWNGCVATPRKVWLDLAGRLRQTPCGAMERLRGEILFQWEMQEEKRRVGLRGRNRREGIGNEMNLQPASLEADGLPLQFELSLEMDEWPEDGWQLAFYDSATGGELQRLWYHGDRVWLDGEAIPITGTSCKLRCFCDGFLWEYFIGAGEAVITSGIKRIPPSVNMRMDGTGKDKESMKVFIWKIMDAKFRDCMI